MILACCCSPGMVKAPQLHMVDLGVAEVVSLPVAGPAGAFPAPKKERDRRQSCGRSLVPRAGGLIIRAEQFLVGRLVYGYVIRLMNGLFQYGRAVFKTEPSIKILFAQG